MDSAWAALCWRRCMERMACWRCRVVAADACLRHTRQTKKRTLVIRICLVPCRVGLYRTGNSWILWLTNAGARCCSLGDIVCIACIAVNHRQLANGCRQCGITGYHSSRRSDRLVISSVIGRLAVSWPRAGWHSRLSAVYRMDCDHGQTTCRILS